MLSQLSSASTDINVAVATYATSRRISCFGNTKQAISYLDNEYQHGGSGLNLLNLALSKMVMRQFDKRPDDRKTRDTAQVSFTFGYFRLGPNFSNISYQHYLWFLSKFLSRRWKIFLKDDGSKFLLHCNFSAADLPSCLPISIENVSRSGATYPYPYFFVLTPISVLLGNLR